MVLQALAGAAGAILAAPTLLGAAQLTVGAFGLPALSGTALSAVTALSGALTVPLARPGYESGLLIDE